MTLSNSTRPINSIKPIWFLRPHPRLKPPVAILSICIVVVLLIWSLANYQAVHVFYGPRAIYSLILLSIILSLLGRYLLLRLLKLETRSAKQVSIPPSQREEWRSLFLFDITAPTYLAAAVLIGIPAAVLTALVTQAFLQGYTSWRGFVSWTEASYRLAFTSIVTLLSGASYYWIAGPTHTTSFSTNSPLYHIGETKEFLGSVVAAIVMLLVLVLMSFPINAHANSAQGNSYNMRLAWYEYLHSPTLRYQALILSVAPLLPVVDIFDDAAAELAWLFFLVPLFAIYYLALASSRLSIRTNELQHTLEDLSSARRRQDELRDYASLITRVQEEERRRLARELHDDTAQALIALSLGLSGLERAIGKQDHSEKDVRWLSNLQTLADETLEGVRRACRDLRPSVLDDLGLRAALEWLGDSSAARGTPCSFICTGSPQSATPESEIAIFRIVQESLSNIWRHAHASQACIELRYLADLVEISVSDNGQGFAMQQQALDPDRYSQSGLGLLGMRERAALVGAQLSVTSSPGQGCTILLSLPLTD